MKKKLYLLDTHALIFWDTKQGISQDFVKFLDVVNQKGQLLVSSISFWETALLVKKGKIKIADIHRWQNELLSSSNLKLINPTVDEMIDSTLLPDHHKDPMDRLLIAQARCHDMILVTKDAIISKYAVSTFWL